MPNFRKIFSNYLTIGLISVPKPAILPSIFYSRTLRSLKMNEWNDWLDDVIQEAQAPVLELEPETVHQAPDLLRQALRTQLEEMINTPLPEPLQKLLLALEQKGYIPYNEEYLERARQDNPLAVGFTGSRYDLGTDSGKILWRIPSVVHTVWTDLHCHTADGSGAILKIQIIPVIKAGDIDLEYRVTSGLRHFEYRGPQDINMIKLAIRENIESNRLAPASQN